MEMQDNATDIILRTRPTEDIRIFFYPLSFGALCDMYCTLALRRANTRSIGRQQEIDYKRSKLKKNIQTMLGQLFFDETARNKMAMLFRSLFRANAQIWAAYDRARNERYDDTVRKDALFSTIQPMALRDGIVRQLDILHSGKSLSYRVYNGLEI